MLYSGGCSDSLAQSAWICGGCPKSKQEALLPDRMLYVISEQSGCSGGSGRGILLAQIGWSVPMAPFLNGDNRVTSSRLGFVEMLRLPTTVDI